MFDRAHVSYTCFLRTTEERHGQTVSQFWNTLKNLKLIEKDYHEGWYSIPDETFVVESAIVESHNPETHEIQRYSQETGHPLEWIKEENYKFSLSQFQGQLLTWLTEHPSTIRPSSRYNEIRSWLDGKELGDLSISRLRSRVDWGWSVPDDHLHTIYVWFDALINYLTVSGYPWDQNNQRKSIFPPDYHIIGKDILRFHAIYWPAFLLATRLPLPKTIVAHAHWTVNSTKMSKSLGNVIDPFLILQEYGVDPVRYFLLRDGPLNDDMDFSVSSLVQRMNSDLADQLGNLLSRTLASNFYTECRLPSCGPLDDIEHHLIRKIQELPGKS